MKKSILVIDEADCCNMCKLGFDNECSDEFECFMEPSKHIENPEGEKPDWCPLRELPEHKSGTDYLDEVFQHPAFDCGWNACLNKINPQN